LKPVQSSKVGETPGLTYGAPIAQSAEAADLKSAQSGFESQWGHSVWAGQGCVRMFEYRHQDPELSRFVTTRVKLCAAAVIASGCECV
jgi:hypothetical protein